MPLTKKDIVSELSRNKVVERLVSAYRMSTPYNEDLCQDIYIELLMKDDDLISGLYDRGETEYFIRKMITNNINSKTSPFWKNYEKFRKTTVEIENEKTEGEQA